MNIHRVSAQLFSMRLIVHFWSAWTQEIHFATPAKFSLDKFAGGLVVTLDRVSKQKHRPNRQNLSNYFSKNCVFSAPPDNFWTFSDIFRHFSDIFRLFSDILSTFPLLGCPTICLLQRNMIAEANLVISGDAMGVDKRWGRTTSQRTPLPERDLGPPPFVRHHWQQNRYSPQVIL